MKVIYILMFFGILASCFHKENHKESSETSHIEKRSVDILIDFEDIYTNQQEKGKELGPWWIFYKTIVQNNTDSTIYINPRTLSVSKDFIKELNQIRDIKIIREKVLNYKSSRPSDFGDVFILYRSDTIPLYCKHSSIAINGNSEAKYRFYNMSEDIIDLYHNYYEKEYKQFQLFLSDIVQKSTIVFIFNKKDTCFVSPTNKLHFYGDPNEQVEWSFW